MRKRVFFVTEVASARERFCVVRIGDGGRLRFMVVIDMMKGLESEFNKLLRV
jgi:hypothetical protein